MPNLHVALYEPEIPPNTGNIIRLCANAGAQLHLIHPLGFQLTDKSCRRAGLDYRELTYVTEHNSFDDFKQAIKNKRLFACTTKAEGIYTDIKYQPDDVFLFGPETRGLPEHILNALPTTQKIKIPMQPQSRSLNLSNATAIILYEAWRQIGFMGASHVAC